MDLCLGPGYGAMDGDDDDDDGTIIIQQFLHANGANLFFFLDADR